VIALSVVFLAVLAAAEGPLPYSRLEVPRYEMSQETLRVLVLDQDRKPVSGAEVSCAYVSGLYLEKKSNPPSARTDRDGRCVFTRLKPSQLYVSCQQGALGAIKQFTVGLVASPPDVELVLGAYHEIKGRLAGPDGEPVAGARTFVENAVECPPTDAFGNFAAQHLVNNTATLTFVKDGFATTTQDMGSHGRYILTMPRGVRLRVRVEGAPPGAAMNIECRAQKRTDVAAVWTGGPLSEPVWIPANEKLSITITCTHNGTHYYGTSTAEAHTEDLEVTVMLEPRSVHISEEGPTPNGSLIRTYAPVEWKGAGTVSGRVLTKETQRPVAATVACQLAKHNFIYTRTKPNGSFKFAGLPDKDVIVSVDADDATLYDPSAIKTYDLATTLDVENVLFELEPGVAISGNVINLESPTSSASVILSPTVNRYSEPIRTEPGGAFTFKHLPPENVYTLALRPWEQTAEFGRISLGTLLPGTHSEDSQLDMRSMAPADTQGVIRGVVTDSTGKPMSGLIIYTEGVEKRSSTGTNMDGTFELSHFQSGPIVLKALEQTHILTQRGHETNADERELLEIKGSNVPERGMNEPVRFVIGAPGPSQLLAGHVVAADSGDPLDYQLECRIRSGQGSHSSGHGEFAMTNLPTYDTLMLEFRAANYQTKVLLEGRDFSRGDMFMRVVLKPLPYSGNLSVFEQITGVPIEKISEYPILKKFDQSRGNRRRID
jgi:hypothetical protein